MTTRTSRQPPFQRLVWFLGMTIVACVAALGGCGGDGGKKQTPANPVPMLTSMSPTSVASGASALTLTLNGSGFVAGSVVHWNGSPRTTTYSSTGLLSAAIPATDLASAGTAQVTVVNPAPGGGASAGLPFTITAVPPVSGGVTRITVAIDGGYPNGPSVNGGMSLFGRFAIFASQASNLVTGDTNGAWDIFATDTCLDEFARPAPGCVQTTRRLTLAADGSQANGDSGVTVSNPLKSLAVSFDGRYVAFVSSASNLVAGDTNGVDDVFVMDTCLGVDGNCQPRTVRVSLRSDGSQSTFSASAPAIGESGGYVAFVSADPAMVPGDANGVADVFLRALCLYAESGCTPGTRRISVAPQNGDANGASHSPTFTGRYVAFVSSASNLVAGDTNALPDVFMRDTCIDAEIPCTPSTERISLGNSDVQADGGSSEPLLSMPMSSMSGYDYHGRFVVFVSTAANLVAGDTNGVADVFMRDTCRGRTGCVPSTQRISLSSTGQQITGAASGQPGHMRWDGQEVLFVTSANGVVPQDDNGVADVYLRGVCHDSTMCREQTTLVSRTAGGSIANGASQDPRGNYEPLGGPDFATFFSTATNILPEPVPMPYYGCIFRMKAS